MPAFLPLTTLLPDEAVLLVILPEVESASHPATTFPQLPALRDQLGTAIRVLIIDAVSHPAVVRSFRTTDLPAFVLVQRGVERWRQRGLPQGEHIGALLLSKLLPPPPDAAPA